MRSGDAWMLNSPYHGGTHLPDITVVSPAFVSDGAAPDFYLASRAHHADIGGITPGSMPPFSRLIDEEGVLFENFQLVSAGRFNESALREALAAARWAARNARAGQRRGMRARGHRKASPRPLSCRDGRRAGYRGRNSDRRHGARRAH
jgi:N-methylhydantoinase B/oxoprolinase/acetone carboxylase alpha subunit